MLTRDRRGKNIVGKMSVPREKIRPEIRHDGSKGSSRRPQSWKPLLQALASSLTNSSQMIIVKYLTSVPVSDILFVRFLGMSVFTLPSLVNLDLRQVLPKPVLVQLVGRGIVGCISAYMCYMSLKLMPIADCSLILSTSSFWIIVLSRVLLKEHFDLVSLFSGLFVVIGMVLFSRVFSIALSGHHQLYSDPHYWYGCLLALGTCLEFSFSQVTFRNLKNTRESVITAHQSVVGTLGSALVLLALREFTVPACWIDAVLLLLVGLSGTLDQFWFSSAMKHDKIGAVTAVRHWGTVVSVFLFQVAFFKVMPDVYSVLAAMFVLISVFLAGLRDYLREKRVARPLTLNDILDDLEETRV